MYVPPVPQFLVHQAQHQGMGLLLVTDAGRASIKQELEQMFVSNVSMVRQHVALDQQGKKTVVSL